MSSISIKTWMAPGHKYQGRAGKIRRRRVLRPSNRDWRTDCFETEPYNGKVWVFALGDDGAFFAYITYSTRVRGVKTPDRIYLPKKIAFSMYLSLKKRGLI